ncbi:MAG TPA: hypothetical protein VNO50_01935 [Pyrinomonadaceae bacterium]|nr:hypothetical protein [Pyrinomonadaceae bacterium]
MLLTGKATYGPPYINPSRITGEGKAAASSCDWRAAFGCRRVARST